MPPDFGRLRRNVFVLSTGRTGTKGLAFHLSGAYEGVVAVHEPRPSYRLRIASNMHLAGRLGPPQMTWILRRSRTGLSKLEQQTYVEANPFLWGFAEYLGDVFHEPLVVHLTRDPRTYVRSCIDWGVFRGLRYVANRFLPYWQPSAIRRVVGGTGPDLVTKRVERLAWFWKTANEHIDRGEQAYGHRYLRMPFERLFAADGSGLRQFLDFVGLPWSDGLLNSMNAYRVNASCPSGFPEWEHWNPELKNVLLRECGSLLETYGYSSGGG